MMGRRKRRAICPHQASPPAGWESGRHVHLHTLRQPDRSGEDWKHTSVAAIRRECAAAARKLVRLEMPEPVQELTTGGDAGAGASVAFAMKNNPADEGFGLASEPRCAARIGCFRISYQIPVCQRTAFENRPRQTPNDVDV